MYPNNLLIGFKVMERKVVTLNKSFGIFIISPALLLSSLLLYSLPVHSAPFMLDDSAMDQISAGNTEEDGGGVIVGNSSEAVSSIKTGVELHDEAQQGASGLNIVNATDSNIANMVNIWDGNSVTIQVEDSDSKPVLEVNQLNQVSQQQVFSASISKYSKPDAEQFEIFKNTRDESYTSNIVDIHDTTEFFEEFRESTTETDAIVNTRIIFKIGDNLYFEGHLGQGIAVSGHAEISLGGGVADIAMVAGGGISAEAGIGVGDSDLIEPITNFNLGETEASAGIDITASASLISRFTLPSMEIVFDGTGCGVVLGSCSASSLFKEEVTTRTDNSTLDVVENHQSGQSSFLEESTTIKRSPFEFESAKAAYIVVDDSSLEMYSDVTLELSDSAQKEIEGLNVVNAIGSNVANATNLSQVTNFNTNRSILTLNQFNIVHHGH